MLEKIDLSRKLEKEEYKKIAKPLGEKLGELQRKAKSLGIPVIVVFEGWEASGKGTLMNQLILNLDPRSYTVTYVPSAKEDGQNAYWPPMRRFWEMTPPRGRIGIFTHSWYRLMLDKDERRTTATYEDISSFERQLYQDGYVIVKFFIHISKKEQKKRLKKMDRDESSTWRVSESEWRENDSYDEHAERFDEVIQFTDKDYAPWTLVEAHDKRYATVKVLTTVAHAIEAGIARHEAVQQAKAAAKEAQAEQPSAEAKQDEGRLSQNEVLYELTKSALEPSILRKVDLTKKIDPDEYRVKLAALQDEMFGLQHELFKVRRPMVIVFEGQDAAGKGGCIRRLVQKLDPRGYQVSPTASPNDLERAHHYLWRFWHAFPKAGHIGIYDRSWYGRVLVERIEGFARVDEWQRAYNEINEMEDQWCRYGAIVIKFWLQTDMDEQLRRFTERQNDPKKQWKITDEDWRNREKWARYEEAAEEMMLRTSTAKAPWEIVEANDKLFARIKVLSKCVNAARKALSK